MARRTRKPNRTCITYNEIAKRIAKSSLVKDRQFTQKEVRLILDSFIEELLQGVLNYEEVRIRGFGYFYRYLKKSRKTQHPKTKEPFIIPSHFDVRFIPGELIKRILGKEVKPKSSKTKASKSDLPVDL